jgi:iron complex transport system substrate-binding protein
MSTTVSQNLRLAIQLDERHLASKLEKSLQRLPMRICSFLPSATEIIYSLGLGDSLYGVSHECNYPPEARDKPRVVRSRLDPASHTSQEIDRLVSEMASRGERIYEVDTGVLHQVKPDLVITQELCEVCAVSYEDVERAVVQLEMPPQLVSLDPSSLDDVLRDIERVGQYTGKYREARRLVADLRHRIEAVKSIALSAPFRPAVACIEWLDPLIVAGHWVPELVQLAGGRDSLAQSGAPSRRIEMSELISSAPDVLILMPCGMDVARAAQELSLLNNLEEWKVLPAVQSGKVYVTDAGSLFSRSGPRLVDSLELMAKMLHPELFNEPLPEAFAVRIEAWFG